MRALCRVTVVTPLRTTSKYSSCSLLLLLPFALPALYCCYYGSDKPTATRTATSNFRLSGGRKGGALNRRRHLMPGRGGVPNRTGFNSKALNNHIIASYFDCAPQNERLNQTHYAWKRKQVLHTAPCEDFRMLVPRVGCGVCCPCGLNFRECFGGVSAPFQGSCKGFYRAFRV